MSSPSLAVTRQCCTSARLLASLSSVNGNGNGKAAANSRLVSLRAAGQSSFTGRRVAFSRNVRLQSPNRASSPCLIRCSDIPGSRLEETLCTTDALESNATVAKAARGSDGPDAFLETPCESPVTSASANAGVWEAIVARVAQWRATLEEAVAHSVANLNGPSSPSSSSSSSSSSPLREGAARLFVSLALTAAVLSWGLPTGAIVQAPPRQLITNLAVRRDVFTLDVMEEPQGTGSGFIWDREGHVVTNFHVIRNASDLRVTLADQSVYAADVVGYDRDKDVAVLRIDAPRSKLRPLRVGSSYDLQVGQKVFAIGNPFGLDHTLTTGVISGLRREISSAATGRPIQDVIQTDAAINPGNSGGPLLDSSGNLIGINTAIYSPSGASSGVGFAIPADTVSGIVEQLIQFGQVTRPVLGISFAPEQSVEQLGVSGVLVLDAPPSGPAGKAGLRPTTRDSYGRLVLGDIITAIDGNRVQNGSDLYRILDRCKVGQTVKVQVIRGDKEVTIGIALEGKN
eukprot:TRINITY_DN27328_c0_g3_i3.p1 TRINITY_DN27328_c0_g3~~TRINITY_DN27328_c0_g3_i3.p1  ORF type:complete len:541 (-),score=4.18 TRINITY_DN27328_c0_g3_i3:197-1738(-)